MFKSSLILLFTLGLVTMSMGQSKYGATTEDSLTCLKNLSVYDQFFEQKNYKDAMEGWRNACQICPKSRKSLYINGVKMYKQFIKDNKENKELTSLYLDTIVNIYQQRIANFGQKGYVEGRMGSDMLKYRRSDPKGAYDVLSSSLKEQGNKMEAGALLYMYQALYYSYKKKLVEKEVLFDDFSKAAEVAAYGIKNAKNEKIGERYQGALGKIEEIFSKVADCQALVDIYTPKFQAEPENKELLKTILKFMDRQKCDELPLYSEVAIRLQEIEPSAEAAYAIAQSKAKKNNCAEAVKFYNQASELAEDEELKAKAFLNAAKCYLFMGQAQSARTYAQKALGVNSKLGDAYLVIANAYAKGAKQCGDNECNNRAAYWAAVDKCQTAKSVDPSVAAKANDLIGRFTAQFPKKEDCFFHSIQEGSSYTVGCWINETTTVRVRP